MKNANQGPEMSPMTHPSQVIPALLNHGFPLRMLDKVAIWRAYAEKNKSQDWAPAH
jgi:hypothetical protein